LSIVATTCLSVCLSHPFYVTRVIRLEIVESVGRGSQSERRSARTCHISRWYQSDDVTVVGCHGNRLWNSSMHC